MANVYAIEQLLPSLEMGDMMNNVFARVSEVSEMMEDNFVMSEVIQYDTRNQITITPFTDKSHLQVFV